MTTTMMVWLLVFSVNKPFGDVVPPMMVDLLPSEKACQKLGEDLRNSMMPKTITADKSNYKVICLSREYVVPAK